MTDDNIQGPDGVDYGIHIPFVVTKSEGGPYDDDSFVAGIRYGIWESMLKLRPTQHSNYEPTYLIPQLNLLAMDQGYSIAHEPWEHDGFWSLVTMTEGRDPRNGDG